MSKHLHGLTLFGLIAGTLLIACGCGGHHGAPALSPGHQPLPVALLAALPPLPQGREASYTEDRQRLGAQTYARSANVSDNGSMLTLTAGAGELEWAIWSLDATSCTPINLDFHLSAEDGECAYLAVSDYQAGRWEICGPVSDDFEFALGGVKHKNAGESVYCAMLAFDGVAPRCYSVTLTVDTGDNLTPQAELLATPDSGMVPFTVSFDASGSFDGDGSIADYVWDLDGDAVFDEAGEEQSARGDAHATHEYPDPGEYTANVRVRDDGGLTNLASRMVTALEINEPPVAVLEANPDSGSAPLDVGVLGMNSYDPDGTISFVWDFDNDGLFSEPGLEEQSDNYSNCGFCFTSAGVYTITAKVTDNDGAWDTESVQITVTGNAAPLADLQADVTSGDAPLVVNFDATGSSDSDGTVADYEWDLDGDQEFNETGVEADARGLPNAQFSYDSPGAFQATVRVTDNGGGTGTASRLISTHGWLIVTLDGEWDIAGTSLALIDGRPAISYCDTTDKNLRYAFSSSPLGASSTDWNIVSLPGSTEGDKTSLAFVDGSPAVAYRSSPYNDLAYVRSTTPGGWNAGDWQMVTIDNAGATGYLPSLAVVDGRPAIAYFNKSGSALMYALSSTASGLDAADWDFFSIRTGMGTDMRASLAVIGSKPAIAYFAESAGTLQYAYASTVDGAAPADWTSIVIDNTLSSAGQWCSLGCVAGKPAISYQGNNEGLELLRYAVSATAQGANPADWTKITVDDVSGFCARYTSLAEVGGKPAIAYEDGGQGVLKYAASSTVSGGNPANWSYEVADGANYCGHEASMAVINGYAAISYCRFGDMTEELRYAILIQ